jgi:hypothetical protein
MDRNSKQPRLRSRWGLAAVIGGGLLMVLAVAAVAVGVVGGNDSAHVVGTVETGPQGPSGAGPTAIPEAALDAFGVLRRDAPADVDETFALRLRTRDVPVDLVRLVIAGDDVRSRYYAVPGPGDTLCFVDGTDSGGCSPASSVAKVGIMGTDECPANAPRDIIAIYGLVPDGVTSVRLTSPDGTVRSAPVTNNGWYLALSRLPAEGRPAFATWERSGTESERQPVSWSPDVAIPCS